MRPDQPAPRAWCAVLLTCLAATVLACSETADVPDVALEAVDAADAAGDVPVPPLVQPVDLLPWARLSASGVYVPAGVPWPREARDAVGTVRDGHVDTGWWVPRGQPAWLAIDLQPAFGAALQVETLTLQLAGAVPVDAVVELFDACGGEVVDSVPWPRPGTPLDLSGRRAGCLRLTWTAPADLRVLEATLTSRDGRVRLPSLDPSTLERPEAPFANHGVVEGFYGVPWSWRERHHLLAALARRGLTSYVYAPKDDPLHRDRWRDPYPAETLAAFADLAALAEGLGMTFLFGISPLIDYDGSSDADYQALLAKLLPLLDVGASGACLLADDIELEAAVDVGADLGAAHAALANRLLADLRAHRADARLWFVPTVYSDARRDGWEGGPAYLAALRTLDADVPVLWTGTDTFSTGLAAADLAAVHAAVGRRPLIWDNFWANDGGDGFFGRLLLGPVTGRAPDLPGAIAGLVQNPSIQGASTRLALGTYAAWLAGPAAYDPASARVEAATAELAFAFGAGRSDAADLATLLLVMAVFDASTLDTPRYAALADAVAALVQALDGPGLPVAEARAVLALVARLAALDSELVHSGLDADLVDDVTVAVQKVVAEGQLGLAALDLLGARLAGTNDADAQQRATDAAFRSKTNRYQQAPRLEDALLKPVGAVPSVDRGFVAATPGADVPGCRVGQALTWRPFEGPVDLLAAGLPGAVVADGELTWSAPHAGVFSTVVVATTPTGWSSRMVSLVCR